MSGHPHLSRDRVGPNAAGQQRQGGLKAVASESYPSRESGDMWRHRPGSSLPAEAGAGLGHVTVYAAGSSGPASGSSRCRSGFFSSSASTKASSSRFDNCSSLIACCSCGVMTSPWPCRISRRALSAKAKTPDAPQKRGARPPWPGSCFRP